MNLSTNSARGISRRTALTGAAWTAPAVLVASAAPAHAASGTMPTVTVTVQRFVPQLDVCQFTYTFNNLGDPTTAFNHSDMFVRTSLDTRRIESAVGDAGWTMAGGEGDAMQTFVWVKDDGVLPSGVTTTVVTYSATPGAQLDMPGTGYLADMTITANPTPGTGSTTMSGFDSYLPI